MVWDIADHIDNRVSLSYYINKHRNELWRQAVLRLVMSRSLMFGVGIIIAWVVVCSHVAVAEPIPPFKVFVQEEFFDSKLRLHHLGPFDTINVRIGTVSYKLPNYTPFYFRPPSDSFILYLDGFTRYGKHYSGQITVRLIDDSLVIFTPNGNSFVPDKPILLRIPRHLKNHLYWFNPYARKGQSVLDVLPIYEKALNALGAARIELPAGDYGWFVLERDSVLRMQSYRYLNGRGPVMFFSYTGPEEILFWTIRKTARDIAQPPNPNIWIDVYAQARERDTLPNDVFYADPDPDPLPRELLFPIDCDIDISKRHREELPQQEVDSVLLEGATLRIFNGDLWEVRNRGFMVANFHLQTILPGNASAIRLRVAKMDDGVYIHSAITYPRGSFGDATQPRFKWVGGWCQFSMPSDTFDLYFINMADTAKFRVMLDSTTIRITRQEVKLVIFKNNLLLRDPLDMFSIYVPWKMCRERAEWMKQVVKKCVKMGAKPVLMPSGFYSTRRGVKQILADSINAFVDKRDSAQVLFFHYTGLRAPIEKAVNAALEDPRFGITADVPLYFGPRSRRDDVIYPGIPKEF